MRSLTTFYEELLRALAAAEVRYVLVGGVAVILHGVPRTTADVDLVLDLEVDNVRRFIDAVGALGYVPRAPVPAIQLADPEARADPDAHGLIRSSERDPSQLGALPDAGARAATMAVAVIAVAVHASRLIDRQEQRAVAGACFDLAKQNPVGRLIGHRRVELEAQHLPFFAHAAGTVSDERHQWALGQHLGGSLPVDAPQLSSRLQRKAAGDGHRSVELR
jgi:hypothetical protein